LRAQVKRLERGEPVIPTTAAGHANGASSHGATPAGAPAAPVEDRGLESGAASTFPLDAEPPAQAPPPQ
jgi:hypothetical protein